MSGVASYTARPATGKCDGDTSVNSDRPNDQKCEQDAQDPGRRSARRRDRAAREREGDRVESEKCARDEERGVDEEYDGHGGRRGQWR